MIFLDTSALMKRYVAETGSDIVLRAMQDDRDWVASILARVETQVSLCHRGSQGAMDASAQRRFVDDWDQFTTIPIDADCLALAETIGCRHRIRTLDAIHLAAALRLPSVSFLSFDERQIDVARALGLEVLPV